MDVFLDCLDLRPGDEFKPLIEAEIKARQLFLLFWSRHAKASEWVTWEWQQALASKVTISLVRSNRPNSQHRHPNLRTFTSTTSAIWFGTPAD